MFMWSLGIWLFDGGLPTVLLLRVSRLDTALATCGHTAPRGWRVAVGGGLGLFVMGRVTPDLGGAWGVCRYALATDSVAFWGAVQHGWDLSAPGGRCGWCKPGLWDSAMA